MHFSYEQKDCIGACTNGWFLNDKYYGDLYLYDLNTFTRPTYDEKAKKVTEVNILAKTASIGKVMRSQTLLWFYLVPVIFVGLLLIANLTGAFEATEAAAAAKAAAPTG